jgi:hypothetical protein
VLKEHWRKIKVFTMRETYEIVKKAQEFNYDGNGCEMCVFVDGEWLCLIDRFFSYDLKPEDCKEYTSPCLNPENE